MPRARAAMDLNAGAQPGEGVLVGALIDFGGRRDRRLQHARRSLFCAYDEGHKTKKENLYAQHVRRLGAGREGGTSFAGRKAAGRLDGGRQMI